MSDTINPGDRFKKNNILIVVHYVENGEVYFQKWPDGVETQGRLDRLGRMGINEFDNAVTGCRIDRSKA